MVSKERARSAIYKALREEFNLTVTCDADAWRAVRDIDSRDLMDLVMEIEYDLDASIDDQLVLGPTSSTGKTLKRPSICWSTPLY